MHLIISLLPLILILILLLARCHMLVAGLAGGILAMVIGKIPVETASTILLSSVAEMMSFTIPVLYAAAAAMVSKAGSIEALVILLDRRLKENWGLLAGMIVLIQAFATYMAGMAAGNTMVIAPLMMASVGAVPEVVAAMAIASAISITTSPASTETIMTVASAGGDVTQYARMMLPLTLSFHA